MKYWIPSTLLVVLVSMISVPLLHAQTFQIENTLVDSDSTEHNDPYTWLRWGLTEEEWDKYQSYMEGEGRFHYKDLDPVFVSGLIANDKQELIRFASLYAQQEFKRTQHLIAFEKTFRAQFRSLYGPLKAINMDELANRAPKSHLARLQQDQFKFGDRVTMFVSPQCTECSQQFIDLRKTYRGTIGVTFDLYFIGQNVTDQDIREWAVNTGITVDEVKNEVVTLNYDDRHETFQSPEIPAAFHVRGSTVIRKL